MAVNLEAGLVATAPDEFLTGVVAPEELSSNKTAGKPAGELPCEDPGRFHQNDTIPTAAAAMPAAPVVTEAGGSDRHADHYLVSEIQAVQRMIRLMKLKEEIMVEKARFAQELVDLQRKIANP